ncbi:hypothetical protein Trydic_g7533 [Trypoxylus dichotomus]
MDPCGIFWSSIVMRKKSPTFRKSRKRRTIAVTATIYQWEAPVLDSPTIAFSPLPLGLIASDFLRLFPDSEPNLTVQNSSKL